MKDIFSAMIRSIRWGVPVSRTSNQNRRVFVSIIRSYEFKAAHTIKKNVHEISITMRKGLNECVTSHEHAIFRRSVPFISRKLPNCFDVCRYFTIRRERVGVRYTFLRERRRRHRRIRETKHVSWVSSNCIRSPLVYGHILIS